ncbi:MAG: hypothetical protein HYY46_01265 [Deltaproteobacteria bacterium]|nr:hypothetical protein [Deltaproteobacteria bacterium]
MQISLEVILLVVELLLLAFTLFVVVQSRREERARGNLIGEMYRTARVFSRQEYFIAVMEALLKAKTEVFGCVTGSSPRADHESTVDRILDQIKVESSKGVNVWYLIPRSPDRIEMGSLYTRAGAKIRYHPGLIVNDLRYMVVDCRLVVIGLPEKSGEREPTRQGYAIPSEGMANLFQDHFERYWESPEATPYEVYVKELVSEIVRMNLGVSPDVVSRQLRIPDQEARSYMT